MAQKMNFIRTKDIDTKNLLIKEGFTLVSEQSGIYTFLNDSNLRFAEKEKFTYTNILSV